MWFETLTGFREKSPSQVHGNMSVDGNKLRSHVNGKEYIFGTLENPTLVELRDRVNRNETQSGNITIRELVADVQQLHNEASNAGSLFQVASQFNLLEMVSPSVTPEEGVDKYESDNTQGPACAIAAGAGTIYRNYFAKVNEKIGQTFDNQIDCLADIGVALGNSDNSLWEMRNGYALASEKGLKEINNRLKSSTPTEVDDLRKLLRVGIQWDTEVTLNNSKKTVSQVYCSALPVAYSQHSSIRWEKFARLVLEASYEATICAAILNLQNSGNNKVYLTLLGGGAFGNEVTWIINAIERCLNLYAHVDLEIIIVSYGYPNSHVQELVNQF